LSAGDEPDRRALATVVLHLRRYVQRVFRDTDADDVVQTTITRLLARPDRLAGARIENPWAYLVGATRNAALDALRARRRQHEVSVDAPPDRTPAEDSIATFIDRDATHAAVIEAFRLLVAADDPQTVRIITTWLDMADEFGEAPSTRQAAVRAGVSHTTVAYALKRFREAISKVR
jgi:RNA polymerase sigma factor (sigma-70 family)